MVPAGCTVALHERGAIAYPDHHYMAHNPAALAIEVPCPVGGWGGWGPPLTPGGNIPGAPSTAGPWLISPFLYYPFPLSSCLRPIPPHRTAHARSGVINAQSQYGTQKYGPRRLRWLVEAVEDLRLRLRARGSDLVVRTGNPASALAELAQLLGSSSPVKAAFSHEESYDEERATSRAVASALPCMLVPSPLPSAHAVPVHRRARASTGRC